MKRFFQSFSFEGAWKYRAFMLVPALLLVGLDQLFKWLAVTFLKGSSACVLWEGVLELVYVENTGAAFSMLANQRWFFVVITSIVMLFLLAVIWGGRYRTHALLNCSLCLVLAGGIGNLIDRIAYGYVVDYIYVRLIDFPVFNFADCCLVVGAVLMLVFFFFVYEDPHAKNAAQKGVEDDDTNADNQ